MVHSELICLRLKVALLKTIPLLRLELETLLLAQLYDTVKRLCGNKINKIRLWSDSTIMLGWIRTSPHTLKIFVTNRVAKIQGLTEGVAWLRISSEDNPADLLLREDSRLFNLFSIVVERALLAERREAIIIFNGIRRLTYLNCNHYLSLWNTSKHTIRCWKNIYKSYCKLCRVVVFCYKFADNCKFNKKTTSLIIMELQKKLSFDRFREKLLQ